MRIEPGVYISLAGSSSLGINQSNRLVFVNPDAESGKEITDLGPATTRTLQSFKYALERLEIHKID